jgi:hypothetical protein
MSTRTRLPLPRRLAAAAVLSALAVGGAILGGPASPAHADAGVNVTVEGHPDLVAVADPTYLTELRVSGSGFQSIRNGFGGIYVMFGWADSGWRPSQGGVTGQDYRYVPDDESNPTGYISFVSFPGSSTEYAANGGEVAADGSWSAVVSVPGAVFTALDRSGNATEVDCREVQCGIITIGAHGVKNANNETFTPVSFRDLYTEDAAAAPAPEATAAAAPEPAPTTYVVEEVAAPAPADASAGILPILLWSVAGVAVLAVAAIAFLVWAVLSSRRRARPAAGSGPTP